MTEIEVHPISSFHEEICVKIDDIIRTHKDDNDFLTEFSLVLFAKCFAIQEMVQNPNLKQELLFNDFRIPKGASM